MKDEEMGKACGTYGGNRIHVAGRKTWRTETLCRRKRRWEDNIKVDHKKMGV